VFLLLLIISEFGGAIWALISSTKLEDEMVKAMEVSFSSYTKDKDVVEKWKSLQQQVIFPSAYYNYQPYLISSSSRPPSPKSTTPPSRINLLHLLFYFYYRYSALGPVWAETRAQSGDWYIALVRCILGKFLGVGCHYFPRPSPVQDTN
jgi:hypothetical protein